MWVLDPSLPLVESLQWYWVGQNVPLVLSKIKDTFFSLSPRTLSNNVSSEQTNLGANKQIQ